MIKRPKRQSVFSFFLAAAMLTGTMSSGVAVLPTYAAVVQQESGEESSLAGQKISGAETSSAGQKISGTESSSAGQKISGTETSSAGQKISGTERTASVQQASADITKRSDRRGTNDSSANLQQFSSMENAATYVLIVNTTDHGEIILADEEMALTEGAEAVLEITPEEGYYLSDLSVMAEECGDLICLYNEKGTEIDGTEGYPDEVFFAMPAENVTVYGTFSDLDDEPHAAKGGVSDSAHSGSDIDADAGADNAAGAGAEHSEESLTDTESGNTDKAAADNGKITAADVLEALGLDASLAVKMNEAEAEIALAAADTLYLTKPETGVFTYYNSNNGHTGAESWFDIGNDWAWCVEPSVVVGNAGSGIAYKLYDGGNACSWLQEKYGWSYAKTIRLTKAVCIAKQLYETEPYCAYALVQNLIWASITEDDSQTGYYLLTDGTKGSYSCSHLSSVANVNAALQIVWNAANAYDTLPSFDKSTVYAAAGQPLWVRDSNGVVNYVNFSPSVSGVTVTTGYSASEGNGIWIKSNSDLAGQSVSVSMEKVKYSLNGAEKVMWPGTEALTIYSHNTSNGFGENKQTVSIWNGALNRTSGGFRVVFGRTGYLKASYTARDAVLPMLDIQIEKTDAETGDALKGAVFEVYMDGKQLATVTTDEEGKAAYHWRGNTLWTGYETRSKDVSEYAAWNSQYTAAKNEVLAALKQDVSNLRSGIRHTWKVVESKAPDGYEKNDEVWEQNFDLNTKAVEIDFTNKPNNPPGKLKLQKVSSDNGIPGDNSCYSLEGAEYGVYTSKNDAMADTNRAATLSTGKNGVSNIVELEAGIYYVKEITASKGYLLCTGQADGAENGIHEVEVVSGKEASFTCKEVPGENPLQIRLTKMDQETAKAGQTRGNTSLECAIFELDYYANTSGATSGTPMNKWFFRTDSDGEIDCMDSDYLVKDDVLQDGTKLVSDALYESTASDGSYSYPIGTYVCREVSAPVHFKNEGTMKFENGVGTADTKTGLTAVVRQDANGAQPKVYEKSDVSGGKMVQIAAENMHIEAYDEVYKGSVSIFKKTADGSERPLEGVTFKLAGLSEGDEYTATTDADGKIVWDNLIPQEYIITEVKAADGRNLLKDNIEVTLPMEMSLDEIKENGADLSQAVYDEAAGAYCFYDLSFTVGNTVSFDMPLTGGNQRLLYAGLIAGFAAAAAAMLWLFAGRKRTPG